MRTVLLTLLSFSLLYSSDPQTKSRPAAATGTPSASLININRLSAWYDADGQMERNPVTGNSGVTYPNGTSTAIYAAGVMMGGYVTDGVSSQPRVTGFSYNKGFVSGAINGIRTGVTDDPTDSLNRIYRIRRDYATADLNREMNDMVKSGVMPIATASDVSIRAQYRKDWAEWPAAKGAPFYDADNDGKYTPKFVMKYGLEIPVLYPDADEPGIAGADQVIYYVSNDVRPGQSPWKTPAIGIELQTTIWGYNAAANTGNGNAIYKRSRMIYKGTTSTPDTAKMKEFYIGQWSDPDLGNLGDDLVGSDSALGIGYAYNSKTNDAEYSKYGVSAPSVGYILLQGPTVPGSSNTAARFDMQWKIGYKNLPMTSFVPFTAGGLGCEPNPPFGTSAGIEFYQNLRGLPSTPEGPPDPQPFIDPLSDRPTHFVVGGDPVGKTGWLDGVQYTNYDCTIGNPGDRRLMMSSGPFTMSLGDTQEVVYALVGGLGADRLASVTVMKFFMRDVAQFYRFLYPDDPTTVNTAGTAIVSDFQLDQNYPNPFNPGLTTIRFTLPADASVALTVYDALGREVGVIARGMMSAGIHSVQWHADDAATGLYYYRLTMGGRSIVKKMLLIK